MQNYAQIAAQLKELPGVTGVAPVVTGKVMIETQPDVGSPRIDAPVIRGVLPEEERSVSVLPKSVIAGKFDLEAQGIVVGRELAQSLQLRVGDRISIYSHRNLMRMKESADSEKQVAVLPDDFEVRGIFDVGFADFNSIVMVVDLMDAQDLFELSDTDGIHGLNIRLSDPYLAFDLRNRIEALLGPGFQTGIWQEDYRDLFGALVVEKNMIRFLLFFIVLVAAFGITSSLITFAVQKTREIGLLRALGAGRFQIASLFILQSAIVGVLGVSAGLVLGLTALKYRNPFLQFMNQTLGMELLPSSIYRIYELPSMVTTTDLAVICGGSLLICLLAGLVPAVLASRLHPVQALRHE